jgi:glycosyltransferase involved in cell wall biosynthesis
MDELPGVSIVISSYNYAQFVALAIESALAQDHPRCEVIVVDDASTDGSQEVIERYRDRVRIILLPRNRGQVAALNEAWPLAQYEIVMFLDSDDLLEPSAASTIARNWGPEIAKIQFQLKGIDADGRSVNHIWPKYPNNLTTETIRQMLLMVGRSHCSPGSGNAYAKWLLERLPPIVEFHPTFDMLLEIHAPFHGEVKTLATPLACYRFHASNASQFNRLNIERFAYYLEDIEDRMTYLSRLFESVGLVFDPDAAKMASPVYLACQIAASRLSNPGHRWYVKPHKVVALACVGFFRPSPHKVKARAIVLLWVALVAVAPRRTLRRLLELRFDVGSRPKWLKPIVSGVVS